MGARALEIGVGYVKERRAFDVPIGSFQAVAHGLSDAATGLDGGLLLAREAAWAAHEDPDRAPSWPHWRVPSTPRRPVRPATAACTTTAATGSCWSTTSSSTSAGPRRGRPSSQSRPTLVRPSRGSPAVGPGRGRDRGLPTGRTQRGLPGRRPGTSSTRSSPTRCGTRSSAPGSITAGTSTGRWSSGAGWPRLAGRGRRTGPGPDGDVRLLRGVPAGRRPHLRRGHDPDGGQRHPSHRHRGAEAAVIPPALRGRSSSSSASPSPSADPMSPRPRPGRCATATSG